MASRTRISVAALAVLASLCLAACGGGGSSSTTSTTGVSAAPPPVAAPAPPPSPTAEGLYVGTTSNLRTVTGIILDNGTYWVIYTSAGNPSLIAGVIEGTGTSKFGSFSSSDARDFNLEGLGISNGIVSGSYFAKQSLSGIVTYTGSNQTISFSAGYSPAYELTPSIATIAGTYIGTAAVLGSIEAATGTISPSGALSGRGTSGCQFAGTIAPHAKGNVYDVSVTFGGGVCSNGTSTVTGIGYFDEATRRLYGMALNSERSNGFIFVGTKQ